MGYILNLFSLAEKYCVELDINSSRVDLELGLFSLKNRNFDAARKLFEKILTANSSKKHNMLDLTDEQHFNIVNQIIKILQGSFNLRIDELEKIHIYLLFRLSCSIIPNEEKTLSILDRYRDLKLKKMQDYSYEDEELYKKIENNKSIKLKNYIDVILLDEYLKKEKKVIIEETLYYVKQYGTPTQLLNFYIDNDMLDETIDYIINNTIKKEVFTDEVVKRCFKKRRMMLSLCSSLKKAYMNNKYALDLIEEVIKFLRQENSHEDLIQLYMLLNDYLQAALQAIQITKKTNDVEVMIEYYNKAVENLKEHLSNNKESIIHNKEHNDFQKKIDRNSLERLLTLLMFQIRVLNIKKDIKYSLITDEEEERYKIVQEIITLNEELALDIINEYKLKVSDIFMRATREFVVTSKFNEFDQLLGILATWQNKGLIEKFSENFHDLWNNILIQAISLLIPLEDEKIKSYVKDNIIPNFTDDYSRMYALFIIDELEHALFLAFELKNYSVIQEIKTKALEANNTKVLELIDKYNI